MSDQESFNKGINTLKNEKSSTSRIKDNDLNKKIALNANEDQHTFKKEKFQSIEEDEDKSNVSTSDSVEDLISVGSENSGDESNRSVENCSEDHVVKINDDSLAPQMEPKSDFKNFVAKLKNDFDHEFNSPDSTSKSDEESIKDSDNSDENDNDELKVTKKRKNDKEPAKTYYNRKVLKPTNTKNSASNFEDSKRREKINRFENVCQSIYKRVFKLNPEECELLAPVVKIENFDFKKYLPEKMSAIKKEKKETGDEVAHSTFTIQSLYGFSSTAKQILERQDYMKSTNGNPTVRISTRPQMPKQPVLAADFRQDNAKSFPTSTTAEEEKRSKDENKKEETAKKRK